MTAGEMRYWTSRLTSILNGPEDVKNARLDQLAQDIQRFYTVYCPMVRQMLNTIEEWRDAR